MAKETEGRKHWATFSDAPAGMYVSLEQNTHNDRHLYIYIYNERCKYQRDNETLMYCIITNELTDQDEKLHVMSESDDWERKEMAYG